MLGKYCYLFCTLQNKLGKEISNCWNCNMSEVKGKTFIDLKGQGWCFLVSEEWSVGLCFEVFFFPSSTDQQRFFNGRRLCVEAARRGQVLSLWNYVVSFRLWCWDVQKSQQYNTSEESRVWALNTLINVSMWFKGKDEDFFLPWELQCCFVDIGIFLSPLWDTKPLVFHYVWYSAFQISEHLKDVFYVCCYKRCKELKRKAFHLQLM